MKDESSSSKEDSGIGLSGFVAGVFILLAAYVIAVGPAVKLFWKLPRRSPVGRAIQVFYAPLEMVDQKMPAAHKFFCWYVEDVWKAR